MLTATASTAAPVDPSTRPPQRAAIYTRVSHDKAHGRSVQEQEQECRRWAEREGWPVVAILSDNDMSASKYGKRKRPDWEKVKHLIPTGTFDILITWEASRAQRDLEAYTELRKLCRDNGVKWAYNGTVNDFDDKNHRLRTTIDAAMAEYSADETRERVMRSLTANLEQRKPHGQIPYGYRREYDPSNKAYLGQFPDEYEAGLIREAVSKVLAGSSIRSIAEDWNRRDIATPYANSQQAAGKYGWQPQQVRRIITNPAINGRLIHRKQDVGPGNWAAIVDDTTFHRLISMIAINKTPKRNSEGTLYLLSSGLLTCGKCGGPMQAMRVIRQNRRAYRCAYNQHLLRDMTLLDAYVERTVISWVRNGTLTLPEDQSSEQIVSAHQEQAALRQQVEDALEQFKTGNLSALLLGRIEADANARIERIQKSIRIANIPTSVVDLVTSDDPESYWLSISPEQRREALRCMVRIVVHPANPKTPRGVLDEAAIEIIPR